MSVFANMLIFNTEDKVEIWLLFISSLKEMHNLLMTLNLRWKFSGENKTPDAS